MGSFVLGSAAAVLTCPPSKVGNGGNRIVSRVKSVRLFYAFYLISRYHFRREVTVFGESPLGSCKLTSDR